MMTTLYACRYEYSYKGGRTDYFGIHFVPLSPGVTRSFFKLTSRNAPKGFGLISKIPPWLVHNLGASLNDQDAIMLHGQVCGRTLSCAALCFALPSAWAGLALQCTATYMHSMKTATLHL